MRHQRFSFAVMPAVPVALFVCICGEAFAQNAIVSGRVIDTSGSVIPKVAVELINRATQVKSPTLTNAEGIFVFPSVPPGTYEVSARISGFTSSRIESVTLEVGQSKTLNLTLAPGDVKQSVTVTDQAPLITTDRADRGTVVENQFVTSIPLLTRNPLLLVTMTAGAIGTATPGGGLVAGDNTVSENQTNYFRINGGRNRSNEILIDGAADTGTYNNQASAIPQIDAVQEFKINTNPYDAELGHTGGGIISYTIKSGTNEFHGSLHEFLQNAVLNANGFNANKASTPRRQLQKNQFGFALGAPLSVPKLYSGKNRTFYFFAYEGLRQHSFSSFTGTVPTAPQKQGDFSNTFDTNGALKLIYDPSTTRLDPTAPAGTTRYIRDTFPGNRIPTAQLNPVATNLLKYFPAPNQPGIGLSDTNNYFSPAPSTLDNNRIDARIDHSFSTRHVVFARGDYFANLNSSPDVYNSPVSPVNTPNLIPGWAWALGHTWSVKPSTVFVQHFSMADSQTNRVPLTLGFDQKTLGFPSAVTEGQLAPFFPQVTVAGTSGVGAVGTIFNVVISRTYEYNAALTILKGTHTIKTGFDYRYYTLDWTNPTALGINANGTYTGGSNAKAVSSNTGAGIADLLLGVASVSYNINPEHVNSHPYYAAYVQDEWRATKNLTLTLGVRYNLELGSIEQNNHYVYLDTASPSPLKVPGYNLVGGLAFTGVNGNSRRVERADRNNWDPRAGLAWRIGDATVLRAGFGIFHNPLLSTDRDTTQGFSRTTSNIVAQADGVTPTFNLSNPFPQGVAAPTGSSLGLATNLGLSIAAPVHNRKTPYQEQWSFDIQRQLPWSIIAELGYTGTHGVALPGTVALNQLPLSQLARGTQLVQTVANPFFGYITDPSSTLSQPSVQSAQLLRPYPQFTGVNQVVAPVGFSSYHALEVKVERRFAQGMALLFNWTHSKAIDNVGENTSINNANCFSCDRSLSYLDTPDAVNLSGRYELPFGAGKKRLTHGPAAKILGNWAVAGIYSYSSGFPVAVTSPDNSNAFDIGPFRPIATGLPARLPGGPQIKDNGQYFNPAAFARTPQFQFGNVSRYLSDVRYPPNFGLNALIEKQLTIHERLKMEFRTELFNVTNSVNFAGPQNAITSSAFGTISLTQVNNPRAIQFGLRIVF
jgi:Carboxypeptidase regulatory-like domain/TonB dependent receptor-like, beta-barrel